MLCIVMVFVVVIHRFAIDFDESVELDHLAVGYKLVVAAAGVDVCRCLFYLGICHLAGNGAFPYQFVEAFFLCVARNFVHVHESGSDGFVCLLRTL